MLKENIFNLYNRFFECFYVFYIQIMYYLRVCVFSIIYIKKIEFYLLYIIHTIEAIMFKQVIRKFSTDFKPIYTSKEYVNLYINNSKDKFNILYSKLESQVEMQNKVLFSSVGLLFGIVGWSIAHSDKRFEQVDKRFEQVDKRFEHIENEIKDIKNILIEGFSKSNKKK